MFTHDMFSFQTTIQQMQGMVLFYHVIWIDILTTIKAYVIDNLIIRMVYEKSDNIGNYGTLMHDFFFFKFLQHIMFITLLH